MVGAGIGGALVHGHKMGPRRIGAGHDAHQGIGIIVTHRLTEARDTVAEQVQGLQQRGLVLAENVMPHHRIGAGDTGEVAKTAGSIAEDLCGVALPGQSIHQRKGQQMG